MKLSLLLLTVVAITFEIAHGQCSTSTYWSNLNLQLTGPALENALYNKIKATYDEQTTAYYAAARLWVDSIIDPRQTRVWLSKGIEMADHGTLPSFNPGVIQT